MTFNKEYKNIYLVTAILAAFILFMVVSTYIVIKDVTNNRSCVKTCKIEKFMQKRG